MRSEHKILIRALASQFEGKLGVLKETDDLQAINYGETASYGFFTALAFQ